MLKRRRCGITFALLCGASGLPDGVPMATGVPSRCPSGNGHAVTRVPLPVSGCVGLAVRLVARLLPACLLAVWCSASDSVVRAAPPVDPGHVAAGKPAIQSDEIPLHCPAQFITAMVPDGYGGVWVAGEDTGIYHGALKIRFPRPNNKAATGGRVSKHLRIRATWTAFNKSNSPGLASNSITALCVDGQGRLWAGTDRHGICVYNLKTWAHYGILSGPLGCHVYAIAYDRYANQVWIATENGISIYQCEGNAGISPAARKIAVPRYAPHTWHYITGINGLPPNPDCIAFDSSGTAYIGTQCNGLVVAAPAASKYYSSDIRNPFPIKTIKYSLRLVTAPWRLPWTPNGPGLPSNLINRVLIMPGNCIYVATDLGLAASLNDGKTFRYERGSDYAAKVLGLWPRPTGFRSPSPTFLNRLLPGDHVTCLERDVAGHLWMGTWRDGYESLDPRTGQFYQSRNDPSLRGADGDISAMCPVALPERSGGTRQRSKREIRQVMLIGRYGFGVSAFRQYILPARAPRGSGRAPGVAARRHLRYLPVLPSPAAPPKSEILARIDAAVSKLAAAKAVTAAPCTLPSDWQTQGNWIDRYGTFADVCASMNGDGCDQAGGYENSLFTYRSWVGPAGGPRNYLRYWVQWVHSKQNRVLQNLNAGGRKESEWDDHGEAAAVTQSGLGVFCTIYLPKGVFEISSYCVNKDGHDGTNRDRDYVASLCQTPMPERLFLALGKNPAAARIVWQMMHQAGGIAHSRVDNFWDGVYTRFAVRQAAPGYITLALHRNFSFNTITCGVFINRVDGKRQDGNSVFFNPISAFTAGTQPQAVSSDENAQHIQVAVKLLNDILFLRRHHPLIYMRCASALAIPVLRYFIKQPDSTVPATASVAGLRRSLALLARDAGLFSLADRIRPPRRLFESYCWNGRTRSGQGMKWQWSQSGYDRYLIKLRKKFIASR